MRVLCVLRQRLRCFLLATVAGCGSVEGDVLSVKTVGGDGPGTQAEAGPPVKLPWAERFGGAGLDENAANAVAVDGAGNIAVAGSYVSGLDLGDGPLTTLQQGAFLAKFDAAGKRLWSHAFYGDDFTGTSAFTVASTTQGETAIAGIFSGRVTFGGPTFMAPAGGVMAYVAKFDSLGKHVFSAAFPLVADPKDPAKTLQGALRFDAAGNLFFAGALREGSLNLGGGDLGAGPNAGRAILAKFDAAGKHVFSRAYGTGSTIEEARGLAIDANGGPVLCGTFRSVDFGGGSLNAPDPASDSIFIARFDSNGGYLSAAAYGDASLAVAYRVAVDHDGNAVLSGKFGGRLDFGRGASVVAGAGALAMFIAKIGPDNQGIFAKRFGGDAANPRVDGLALEANGDMLVSAVFSGSGFDLDGHVIAGPGSALDYGGFLAKFDPSGGYVWSRAKPGVAADGDAVAVDASGAVVLAGAFDGTFDFGTGPLASSGSRDVFLAKYAP